MPRSGGASKASEQLSQPSSERQDERGDSEEEDSDTEILETSDNGRYQKMIDQVSGCHVSRENQCVFSVCYLC